MNYKYLGKEYSIRLNDAGKIACDELGIFRDTVEEVKEEIKKIVKVDEKLPRQKVYFFIRYNDTDYVEGTSNLKKDKTTYAPRVFVSRTENGKTKNEKQDADSVYVGSEANKKILEERKKIKLKIAELENEVEELENSLERITVI